MHSLRTHGFVCALLACAALLASGAGSETGGAKRYLGLDANDYPGDDALLVLRKTFSFTGYWIGPPPEEKRSSWLGKRALLASRGFGFVVLYSGRPSRSLKSAADAKTKGQTDAETAAKLARQEGFPRETILFLDIEEGGRLSPAYHEYVHAWIDALEPAHFRGGAYCSAVPISEGEGTTVTSAEDLQDHLGGRKLVFWIFNDVCPPAPGCSFPSAPLAVSQGGFAGAAVWQYAQSPRQKDRTAQCAKTYAADGNCYAPEDSEHKWSLDANVADSPNPSEPGE